MPIETGARRWARLVWSVFAAFAAAIVVAALFAVAYIHASHAINCVNDVLGSRGPVALRVNKAQREAAVADKAYLDSSAQIFRAPHAEQVKLAPKFLADLDAAKQAHAVLDAAYAEQAAVQKAHPLGRC